jgi:hypothetical protein
VFPRDTTAPVVTVPPDQTVPAQGPNGAVVTWTASATDDIDGTLPVTCSPTSGALFQYGRTTVTCTAIDAAGNVGAASFAVTVVDPTASGLIVGATLQGRLPRATQVVFSGIRTSRGLTGAAVLALALDAQGRPTLFVATRIDGIAFFDDPASVPGASPASGIDTMRVVGAGAVNGISGHTFELVTVDRGEPGRGRDEVTLTVCDAQGRVVVGTTGSIDGGNVESLFVP